MLSPPSTPAWSLNVIHMTTVLTELEETIHILRVQPQRADWLKFDAPEGRKVSSQSQTRKLIHNSKGQSQDGEQWKKNMALPPETLNTFSMPTNNPGR